MVRKITSVFLVILGLFIFMAWATWLFNDDFSNNLLNVAIGFGGPLLVMTGIIGGLLLWRD